MKYIDKKELKDFEDKYGVENIHLYNKSIGEYLGFEPTLEYYVGDISQNNYIFGPKSIGYDLPKMQKVRCEKYIIENDKQGIYEVKVDIEYPNFHTSWEDLMQCIKRLRDKGYYFDINPSSIFKTWENVLKVYLENKK